MKRLFIGLLALVLAFALIGCGAKEKLEEKAAEKIVEAVGGGDVDIDGDKVTIQGENGEEVTFGNTQWPTSELMKSIPEYKDGEISAVMDSADYVMISLESVKEEEVAEYFQTIKETFMQDVFEMNAEDMTSFSGKNDAGVGIALMYSSEALTITVTAPQT